MILKLSKARQMHLYLGMIFAPSIMFFAFTGSLMVFSLHEDHNGYEPPQWIEVVAQIHKNQKTTLKRKQPELQDVAPSPERKNQIKSEPPVARILLKWFCLSMSIGIILTTGLGIYMSFIYNGTSFLTTAVYCRRLLQDGVLRGCRSKMCRH
jgi:hypothetical protein